MRVALPTAIDSPPELALIVQVPASDLQRVLPVALEPLDSFAEAEPSRGATIELASGRHVVAVYGLVTERLFVHTAAADAQVAVDDFLRETRLPASSIAWRLPARALSPA
jgi:hypothetical protein